MFRGSRTTAKGKKRPDGQWLDEYPFASTWEGGVGSSLRLVAEDEQIIQATQIRELHKILKQNDGYIVLPISSKIHSTRWAPAFYTLPDYAPSKTIIYRYEAPDYNILEPLYKVLEKFSPFKVPMLDPSIWWPQRNGILDPGVIL